MIFEFTYKNGYKDWVSEPSRKDAIYLIMELTEMTFEEVIKECKIRKLKEHELYGFELRSNNSKLIIMRKYTEKELNQIISDQKKRPGFDVSQISDGYHTFNELYEFRKMYNAALFNEWALNNKYKVHKSWKHDNGEWCFGNPKEWFIVSAMLPSGLISNHYHANYWDLFKIPETEKSLFEFDGHTGSDVLERLKNI